MFHRRRCCGERRLILQEHSRDGQDHWLVEVVEVVEVMEVVEVAEVMMTKVVVVAAALFHRSLS